MKPFCALAFIVVLTLVSCTDSHKDSSAATDQSLRTSVPANEESELVVYSLPAPLQIPTKLRQLHDKFYPDLLKPITSNTQSTNYNKALYLGIYSVDLGYATTYNQGQAAIDYLAASVRLSDQLNIPALGPQTVDRFKKNIANQDSINRLIVASFAKVNHLLTETNRIADEGLLITGSFIEGIHLATGIYAKSPSPQLAELIGNQKLFLDNVIEILNNSRGTEQNDALLRELQSLREIYSGVVLEISGTEKDTTREITAIKITDDQIAKITAAIEKIRKRIIES